MAATLTGLEPPAALWRTHRRRIFRPVVFTVAGIYFLVPLAAATWFALYNAKLGFSLRAFTDIWAQPRFTEAFWLSVRLSVVTVLMTLLLMVPTALLIHLRFPRIRKFVEIACLLPLVVPPVVLVVGVSTVLGWGPRELAGTPAQGVLNWLQNSTFPVVGFTPLILVFTYVVMALPFTYRSLDAGLRTSNITALTEAARSLGSSWPKVLWLVAVPALRTSILNTSFLAFALAFGEFTVASILSYLTFAPWMLQYNHTDGQMSVGVAILSLALTWGFLLLITIAGRTRSVPKGSS